MTKQQTLDIREGYKEKFGFHDDIKPIFKSRRGLDKDVVVQISEMKGEPTWMRDFRLKSYQEFERKALPRWGGNVAEIDFQNLGGLGTVDATNNYFMGGAPVEDDITIVGMDVLG